MTVTTDRDGAIATVTLRRPEALNALNGDQLTALLASATTLSADATVRAVILTGEGQRAFAAGADIKEMAEMDPVQALAFTRLGHAVTSAISGAPQPWIAAVNGVALGGGCELALACDIRVASLNAAFGQPEVMLGVIPGWGGTQRLPRLIGAGVASELILTGRRIGADEALRIGLVGAVYPLEDLLDQANAIARTIASNAPAAVQAAKRAIAMIHDTDMAAGLAFEAQAFALSFATADQKEGMAAFIGKRTPEFTGT